MSDIIDKDIKFSVCWNYPEQENEDFWENDIQFDSLELAEGFVKDLRKGYGLETDIGIYKNELFRIDKL